MAVLLCVKANPKPVRESKSLTIAEEFLRVYREKNPRDRIIERNVYQEPIPLVDADVLKGWDRLQRQKELNSTEKEKVGKINAFTEEFLAADKYVFVTPMWNLSLPPLMKAYLDTIVVAGKTFYYTKQGPVGMVKGKRALHIHARGGFYSRPPMDQLEFADRYIRALLNFLGVTDVYSLICEGHEYLPERAGAILQEAVERAKKLAGEF
ncbi:MAG: FMN-dependent NADH-azoreductase [Desulfotomaculales bacterium]